MERYVEIGRILARHGWQSLLSSLGLAGLFHVRGHGRGVPPAPVQVRETLEELGPTFVKLGQVLSTRPDLIPPDYIVALEKLQDQAPTITISQIRKVIQEEFNAPVESVFEEFDQEPLGAASLGQTHLAVLPDGMKVVVKVQRPDIRRVIDNDLEILAGIAHFLEQHFEKLRVYGFSDLVEEFSITIHQELDYTREGRNGDALRENFDEVAYVHVAEIVWKYTTPRVLTAERICGVKINDLKAIEDHGCNRHEIARNLSRAYLKMVFVDGLFHADPHPGNLLVLDNNVIGLLDCGMMGRLDHELKAYVTMLLEEYLQEDSAAFSDILIAMGTAPLDLDRKAFKLDIDRLLRQYYGAPLRELKIGEALARSLRISARHRIRLPASLGLLVKVIIGVEGIDRMLDPDYDLAAEARPFVSQSMQKEFTLNRLKIDISKSLIQWKTLLLEAPHRTAEVLDRMADGTFRVIFKHEGLENSVRDIDRSANRLSFALISSATIIASAQILSSKVGPTWMGYPLIGVVGFAIAFIFAVWLMISIIRAGRMW